MRTPGIFPWSANLRKQIRQRPNLRYTARGRPHRLQRDSARVLNFGFRLALAIFDLLATELSFSNRVKRICYAADPSRWNGIPRLFKSSRDSSLECDEQTNAMFIPCTRVYLSGFNSGNTSCSLSPRL